MTQNPDTHVTNAFMANVLDLFNVDVTYEDGISPDGTDFVAQMAGHLMGLLEIIILERCQDTATGSETFNEAASGYRRCAATFADRVIPANILGAHSDRVMALTTTMFANRVGFTGNLIQDTFSGDAFPFVALADSLQGATSFVLRLLAGADDPTAWLAYQQALDTYIEAVGPLYRVLRGVLSSDTGERSVRVTGTGSDTPNTEVPHARVAGGTAFHANWFPGAGSAAPGAGPS